MEATIKPSSLTKGVNPALRFLLKLLFHVKCDARHFFAERPQPFCVAFI
jgi:hypothetical protein